MAWRIGLLVMLLALATFLVFKLLDKEPSVPEVSPGNMPTLGTERDASTDRTPAVQDAPTQSSDETPTDNSMLPSAQASAARPVRGSAKLTIKVNYAGPFENPVSDARIEIEPREDDPDLLSRWRDWPTKEARAVVPAVPGTLALTLPPGVAFRLRAGGEGSRLQSDWVEVKPLKPREERNLTIELPDPRVPFFCRLISKADGTPICNGSIAFEERVFRLHSPRSIASDATGLFSVKSHSMYDPRIRVIASGFEQANVRFSDDYRTPDHPLVVPLSPGATLCGHVYDAARRGISGLAVSLLCFRPEGLNRPTYDPLWEREATTQEGGSYELTGLPAEAAIQVKVFTGQSRPKWKLYKESQFVPEQIRQRLVEGSPANEKLIEWTERMLPKYLLDSIRNASRSLLYESRRHLFLKPGERRVLDICLSAKGRVRGRIVDQYGHPVTGIKVIVERTRSTSITQTTGYESEKVGASGVDENGRFEIAAVPGGTWLVGVDPSSRAELTDVPATGVIVNVPIEGGDVAIEIRIHRGLFIKGKVVGSEDLQLNGVSVHAWNLTLPSSVSSKCDDDGAFVVGPLMPGEYELSASAKGHSESTVAAEAGATDVLIRLAAGGTISGRVVDSLTGNPRAGRVFVTFTSEPLTMIRPIRKDGNFELDSLRPGVYDVYAATEGDCVGLLKNVQVGSGERVENLVVEVRPGGTLTVTLSKGSRGFAVKAYSRDLRAWIPLFDAVVVPGTPSSFTAPHGTLDVVLIGRQSDMSAKEVARKTVEVRQGQETRVEFDVSE